MARRSFSQTSLSPYQAAGRVVARFSSVSFVIGCSFPPTIRFSPEADNVIVDAAESTGHRACQFSFDRMPQTTPRKLGPVLATMFVTGNMVGSGLFLLPATLGALGGISVFTW